MEGFWDIIRLRINRARPFQVQTDTTDLFQRLTKADGLPPISK